jgi:2-dehydropantoate 2-reductase
MGAYKPSTLLDLEAGRALEVEAIWVEPLRRAQAQGPRCRGQSSFIRG